MEAVLETQTVDVKEITSKLGITPTKESIASLEKMFDNKLVSFHPDTEEFTYFLRFPVLLHDGCKLSSLLVRESYGNEMAKVDTQNLGIQYGLDMLAVMNGIPSTIVGRIKSRDICNLAILLGLFI